jgi:hypothetical protein
MEQVYELVLEGRDARLVTTHKPVEVGDALVLEGEILLVLRESGGALGPVDHASNVGARSIWPSCRMARTNWSS